MSMKLNRAAYQQLVDEDLEWLSKQPRTLEREHVIQIVRQSVDREYPEHDPAELDRLAEMAQVRHYLREDSLAVRNDEDLKRLWRETVRVVLAEFTLGKRGVGP